MSLSALMSLNFIGVGSSLFDLENDERKLGLKSLILSGLIDNSANMNHSLSIRTESCGY